MHHCDWRDVASHIGCHPGLDSWIIANEPTFRVAASKHAPDITLNKGQKWHLFLSHIWSTGTRASLQND